MPFDLNGLLENPAFLAGISILGGDPRQLGRNALAGLQTASDLQTQNQMRQIRQQQMAQQQARQAFDPTQFMRGGPAYTPMDAGQVGPPMTTQGGVPMDYAGQRQTTDTMGLLGGAWKAGYGPHEIAPLINAMSPKKELLQTPVGLFNSETMSIIPGTGPEAKAPPMRRIIRGDQEVDQQFDPKTMQWTDVSQGQRWQDKAQEPLVQVADESSPTGTKFVTRSEAIGMPGTSLVPKSKGAKNLPAANVSKLADTASLLDNYNNLISSFKPEFGGYKSDVLGSAVNAYQRNIGGDQSGQADWWQQMDKQQTQIRHDLMGSQLTQYEGTQFSKFQVSPGQSPDVIRKNLQHQSDILDRANKKRLDFYGKAGYDVSGFQGPNENAPTTAPAAAPAAPAAKRVPTPDELLQEAKRRGLVK